MSTAYILCTLYGGGKFDACRIFAGAVPRAGLSLLQRIQSARHIVDFPLIYMIYNLICSVRAYCKSARGESDWDPRLNDLLLQTVKSQCESV